MSRDAAQRQARLAGQLALDEISRTAQTGEASTVHKPLGKPGGPGLWHTGKQLPAYIQSVAQHLRAAHGESRAIEMAVGIVKNWAAGHDGHGNRVHPDVQAAAAKAVAEWEKLRAEAHSTKARRSAVADTKAPDYDADGLDGSWDGDHSDLPDLTGLQVHHFEQAASDTGMAGQESASRASAIPLGSGGRFKKLSASLAAKGAHDPDALAAWIGRKKYGRGPFKKLAAAARKAKGGSASRSGEIFRFYNVDDIHIVSRADGDGSGRVVEAYAAVFDDPVPIRDDEGRYEETIDRGAFDQELARIQRSRRGLASAVRVLYNHGKTMEGIPAPEYQKPLGKPLEVRPDGRGLLTRTEYAKTALGEEILELVRSGALTAQSFVGRIIRSDPPLRGPGDRYRARNGILTRVRRLALGLQEYGPVLYAAYPGAEVLGVRMGDPRAAFEDFDPPVGEEYGSADEESVTGGVPEDTTSARYHQHELYALRSQEQREAIGLTW